MPINKKTEKKGNYEVLKPSDESPLDIIAKELSNARELIQKKARILEAKERAKKIKSLLLQHLSRSCYSNETKSYLEKAVASCDSCIHAPEHAHSDEHHHEILEHIGQAQYHLENAINNHHKTNNNHHIVPTHGMHCASPELRHILHDVEHGIHHQ